MTTEGPAGNEERCRTQEERESLAKLSEVLANGWRGCFLGYDKAMKNFLTYSCSSQRVPSRGEEPKPSVLFTHRRHERRYHLFGKDRTFKTPNLKNWPNGVLLSRAYYFVTSLQPFAGLRPHGQATPLKRSIWQQDELEKGLPGSHNLASISASTVTRPRVTARYTTIIETVRSMTRRLGTSSARWMLNLCRLPS